MNCIIDKKSGKVEPWTALQTAGYSLLDTPVEFMEEVHGYFLDGVQLPSVTEILKHEGFIDDRFYDEWSRQRGSAVHLATQYDDLGELDEESLDPRIAPYVEAWRKFKRESGFIVDTAASEVPLASKIHRYAGKLDVRGEYPGTRIKRAAVELHDDGTYKVYPYTDRQDVQVWLSAVATYYWKLNNLRR